LKEEKALSKLLSFETIKAKTFYEIQKNLSQIAKRQKSLNEVPKENLGEKIQELVKNWQETMNLLGKAKPEIQQKRWQEIVEKYYREVDESSFEVFLKDKKKDIKWDCDLALMEAGFTLASLGFEDGWDALKEVGIVADNIDKARQKINAKVTNRELKSKNEDEPNEPVDFFTMLAKMRKSGYNIDSGIILREWIGVLKDIKENNERQNSAK